MNNKGFTLVELIVVISMSVVISLIAYPAIQKMQQNNKDKVYEQYGKAMISGGKLYVEKYTKDIFPNDIDGCSKIMASILIEDNELKEFNQEGVNCPGNNQYIKVEKNGSRYTYDYALICSKDGEEVYKKTLDTSTCSVITE